jgi:hypothetical protein
MSVLEKAQTLAAVARTYAEGADEQAQRQQIGVMLAQLEREVAQLRTAVHLHSTARALGLPVEDVGPVLADGLDALKTRASQGLPTQQALRSARDKARRGREAVESAVATAWEPWTQEQLAALQVDRVKRLGPQHRLRADELVRRLRTAASASQISTSLLGQFRRDFEELKEALASIEADDPFVVIFNRIRSGRLTLADLTDDEVYLLRSDPEASSQVSLRLA